VAVTPPILQEEHSLSGALLAVRVMEACASKVSRTVDYFLLRFTAEAASRDHFAHYLLVQLVEFFLGEVTKGERIAYTWQINRKVKGPSFAAC
jgi:hypothetical protein